MFGKELVSNSLRSEKVDELFDEGLTMGTLYIGKQGTGKTTALARHLVEYFKRYPDRPMFILDWSGGLTDSVIAMLKNDPESLKRIVYDQLGNPDWVVPMPEFSTKYGDSYEEQIQRVSENFKKLNPELSTGATVLGGVAINQLLPNFFRLVTAMTNEPIDPNETWQITEVNRLIDDVTMLRRALGKYGTKIPDTSWFIANKYLGSEITAKDRDLRTSVISALLSIFSIRETKARLGYNRPGWTPKEAIAKGQMVIVDGANLINQPQILNYLFTQVHSMIIAELNHRRSGNPDDKHVSLVLDEVRSFIEIPGMAADLFRLPSQYRSRRLQVYLVLQNLKQVAEEIRDQVWSLGNIVCFALFNFDDAFDMAQQLFAYDPRMQKLSALSNTQQPVMEVGHGQSLVIANWIQRLQKRECIIRRHIKESDMQPYIFHVPKTKDSIDLSTISFSALDDLKQELLEKRAVRVSDALEVINRRFKDELRDNRPPSI